MSNESIENEPARLIARRWSLYSDVGLGDCIPPFEDDDGDWCKYEDVKVLEDRIDQLAEGLLECIFRGV